MRCNYCFLEHSEGEVCPDCGYKRGDPADELFYLYPGTVLQGRYTIGKTLGAGGFGIVYKAWDTVRNVPVAIKEYYPSGLVARTPGLEYLRLVAKSREDEFESGKRRFDAEREGTTKIDSLFSDNPSLLHDVASFDDNGTSYMVMEFLDGTTLTEYIEERGPMSLANGLGMIHAVLDAVRDIHSLDIIHRDISPDNIMLCSNQTVKLFDLGAAKFGKGDSSIYAERVMKPGYSPPEQYEPDGRTGVHTDIYAVGATLYFALTGLKPVEATNRKDDDLLASPQSLNEDIPKNISDAILKAMAVDYRMRFKNSEEFSKALRGEVTALRPEAELKKRKFRRFITVAASFLILCAAAAVTYILAREAVPTLNDATVELWYVSTGNELRDGQKNAAFERIVQEFTLIYPNVAINLRAVGADELAAEVAAAINQDAPVLFESDAFSGEELAGTLDLSAVASRMSNETHFLGGYTRLFSDRNQMPTGFAVACIFINTTLTAYEGDEVDDLIDLLGSMPVAVSKISVFDGHEADFATAFGNVPYAPLREFFENNAGALFTDTSEWEAVQSAFAGRYRLLRIEKPEVPASFGGNFSAAGGDRDERAALLRLLEFMLTENAQDALHIQANSGYKPLNKTALDTYQEVFSSYSEFFINMENYVFTSR